MTNDPKCDEIRSNQFSTPFRFSQFYFVDFRLDKLTDKFSLVCVTYYVKMKSFLKTQNVDNF